MRKVLFPSRLEELWQLWKEEPQAAVMAGGTDLLVMMRQGLVDPPALLCLERIEELDEVRDQGDQVFIGAAASHSRLLADPLICGEFPVLAQALRVLGSPPIRNMGTIGGNICTASPAGDTLPPLYVLEAEVELHNKSGSRRMPIADFITGPGRTRLASGEILTGLWLPKVPEFNLHHFEKVGQRKALAISMVSLAVLMKLSGSGTIQSVRLAWGSVGPTIVTAKAVEAALSGKPLNRETLQQAARLATEAVAPISDLRAGAEYRGQVAGNLLLRLLAGFSHAAVEA